MKLKPLFTALLLATLSACAAPGQPTVQANDAYRQTLNGDWQIIRINGQPAAPDYRLSFDPAAQRFSAYFGCNRIMGGYQQQADQLSFSHVASTMMACPDNADETPGLAALAQTHHWQTAATKAPGSRLILSNQQGQVLLEAYPAPQP